MAVELIAQDYSPITPIDYGDAVVAQDYEMVDPYGGGGELTARYQNKAWYTITLEWVYWVTDEPDPTGASYPGPGSFGDCTNYRVEMITYQSA